MQKYIRKLIDSNLHYAVLLFGLLLIFGIYADVNYYQYKRYGIMASNYVIDDGDVDVQEEYTMNFPWKTNLIDFNGWVRLLTGQREMNGVVKLNNGYLTQVAGQKASEELIAANVEEILRYNAYCSAQGIEVLFAQPAYKISKWDEQLPTGVTDGHNDTIDEMLRRLEEGGVRTLDLRECMREDGQNPYELYYKTDHHWTTEGAFYGYRKIAERLAQDTGTALDGKLLDLKQYEIETYPGWHLGIRGQRTGKAFAGIDDYDLIYPKFETHIYNRENGKTQSLKDALVKTEVFENRNAAQRYTYDQAYSRNDINQLVSRDAVSDLKVLLLSDSYKYAIDPYFLMTYREFHVESYREMSAEMLRKYQPDVVVILAWPGYYYEEAFHFTEDDQ